MLALWRYDKGEANGASFVYFGLEAVAASTPEARALAAYALAALDALNWRWGPAHLEVMSTPTGPRLVEANAGRWNGIDHAHVAESCFGRTAYDATLCAFLGEQAEWDELPHMPPPELRQARRALSSTPDASA